MIWICVALMSLAVFVLLGPDPARRLELIAGFHGQRTTFPMLDRITRLHGRQARQAADRKAAIHAIAALAAELRAGTPQNRALQRAGDAVWPAACGAVRFDGDVAEALRIDAERTPMITPIAACWAVASQQGNGLAVAVSRMADQARASEEIRLQLSGQMAGPRATARILMILPIFGIAMGVMMGVDPLVWLLGNPLGFCCLLGGCALAAIGYWWTSRIVHAVEALL